MIVQEEETTQTNRSRVEDATLEYPLLICRHCSNTNTSPDINSCDGLTTTTTTEDSVSREQRLAVLRRTLNCRRGYSAHFIDEVIEKKYRKGTNTELIQRINARIQEDIRKFPELRCNENNNFCKLC